MKKKGIAFLIAVITLTSIDQALKLLACSYLQEADLTLTPFLQLTLLFNKGVSWSFLTPSTAWQESVLLLGIIILLCMYSFHVYFELQSKRTILPEILIVSGALSNIIDRCLHPGVVDFILLHYQGYQFPVFNGADLLIFIGFLLFLKKGVSDEFC